MDVMQALVAIAAFLLQIYATILARPLASVTPKKVWRALMFLNFFVLLRRGLSIVEIVFNWKTEAYESVAVLIGLSVSICMVATVLALRKHLRRVREEEKEAKAVALAMIELGKEKPIENTAAYKLALHFIDQHKNSV